MTIVKTSELSGRALDWAVAKCEADAGRSRPDLLAKGIVKPRPYSESWECGGPIIEREHLEVHRFDSKWRARSYWHEDYQIYVSKPVVYLKQQSNLDWLYYVLVFVWVCLMLYVFFLMGYI